MRSFLHSDQGDKDRLTEKLCDADSFRKSGDNGHMLRRVFEIAATEDGTTIIVWPDFR